MEASHAPKPENVTVTLGVISDGGEPQIVEKTIPAGPTKVPALKSELGVPADAALWLVQGKAKRPLGDHETVPVHEHDHFEAVVRGGVS